MQPYYQNYRIEQGNIYYEFFGQIPFVDSGLCFGNKRITKIVIHFWDVIVNNFKAEIVYEKIFCCCQISYEVKFK